MLNRIGFALALTLPLFAACADSADELANDDAAAGDDAKADAAGGTYTYYFVEQDLRACVSPVCGGVFYKLANGSTTTCLDGKKAANCYAASVDWTKLGLKDATLSKVEGAANLLVRATVKSKSWPTGSFAELRPTEAWLAQGPKTADGPLAKIGDSGIRCITAPCASLRERKLNSTVSANISELGWDDSGASDHLIETATDKIPGDGVIVAGYRYSVGSTKARTVTQFWLRATDAKQCFVGGCSGQVCSEKPGVITTCEWRPEYACYHQATCEVQADGNCDWTQTTQLQACLANPPN